MTERDSQKISISGTSIDSCKEHVLPHEPPFTYRHTLVDGIVFPSFINQSKVDYIRKSFPFRNGDVFVATYPKSGTTWTQNIIKNLLGFDDNVRVVDAVPWIEKGGTEDSEEVQAAMNLQSNPRCFKTHTPWQSVAKSRTDDDDGNAICRLRYIFVARNPKDVCVSMYHHARGFRSFDYRGDFDHFFQMFLHGEVESGSWLDFNLGYYSRHKKNPNEVLFLTYEDMHRNPIDNILRIAKFLGVACSRGRADGIVHKTTFAQMKTDPAANYSWANDRRHVGEAGFMREGKVGDYRNYMSKEQERLIEERMIMPAREQLLFIKDDI